MASQFNLLLHTYPKLRSSSSSSSSSTPPSYTIKTSRQQLELPFHIKEKLPISPFQLIQRRKNISPIECSLESNISSSSSSSYSWVETYIPEKARPYAYLMRWHKFRAGPLLTMPCLWSIAFTTEAGKFADAKILALFFFVGCVHRGILCTVNDILDRDVDAKVKRTASRPLASGALTVFQGISCLCLQTLLCFCLLQQVNPLSRKLWFASLVLGFTYPLMKRLTFWPQAYLGLVINSFNLCGWSAVKGCLDPRILLPLCTAGFFWALCYDTIYAHQDKEDDAKIGVKSTALLFGNSTKIWLVGFSVAAVGALASTGYLSGIGWPYYASLVVASIHLAWQILSVDLDSSPDCFMKFESNLQIGAIVLCGIIVGRLYH